MSFDSIMMKRLASCHAEACTEVQKSVKSGRALSDAVLDTIESLPKSKTRELRQWVRDWELIGEWQDKWEAHGWRFRKHGREFEIIGSITKEVAANVVEHWRQPHWSRYAVPESYFPPSAVLYAISGAKQLACRQTGLRGERIFGVWKSI